MAVNINTVYTTVLYILNKEQRGYVTPTEFNSIAAQVQEEIFNSYFPDGNQVNRQNQKNTQNDTEFFNMFKDVAYKLHPFEKTIPFIYDTGLATSVNAFIPNIPIQTLYKIGDVISNYTGNHNTQSITQLVSVSDYNKITRSKLTKPTISYPLFYTSNADVTPVASVGAIPLATANSATATLALTSGIPFPNNTVSGTGITGGTTVVSFNQVTNLLTLSTPQTLAAGVVLTFSSEVFNSLTLTIDPLPNSITVNGITTPTAPLWAFSTGSVGQYIWNSGESVDFELDVSEKTNIVINILKYCGIIINDPLVVEAAMQEAQQVETNEKS
jgi:hypothetical protein